jgi:catechol 2,3-dioxygenase-like lactoylglutathione lyase family enzyme
MIDHVGFSVSDFERAKAFYTRALAPLGYTLIREIPGEKTEAGFAAGGFGAGGKPDSGSRARANWSGRFTSPSW